MKNKKMIEAWDKVDPDETSQRRMLNNIHVKSSERRKAPPWRRLVTVAVAVVVVFTGVFIYSNIDLTKHTSGPQPTNGNQTVIGPNQTTVDLTELPEEIKGLPVKNFKMSEIESSMTADRVVFRNLIDFFEYKVDSFAIVKVGDTKSLPSDSNNSERQISTVNVLETVWGDKVPETIEIMQSLYGGCTGDEITNLMRTGGVYLLPLVEDGGKYYIISDLDVLFEIDNEGLIWSHSDYDDFNRFDGGDYKAVTDEIKRITQDDTIMLATSRFGMALRGFQLAEVTILSEKEEEKNEYGEAEVTYIARVEKTLSGNDLTSEGSSEVTIRSYANDDLSLNNGGQYLLFIDNYDEKHYINNRMIASVDEADTIKDVGDEKNPFSPYSGYTVAKIQELADKTMDYLRLNQE